MPVQTSFGGADPTLVTAATRAGLASAPRDYGKAFQAVADSYHKMVTANAEIWSKVIWAAGTKIADEIKTYTESPPVSEEAADMMGKDGGKWLKEELERIKGAMKETLGITKKVKTEGKEGKEGWMITPGTEDDPVAATKKTKFNNPVSKENKEIRAKLLAERNDLYANLQHQVDNADAAYGFFQLGDAPGGVWGESFLLLPSILPPCFPLQLPSPVLQVRCFSGDSGFPEGVLKDGHWRTGQNADRFPVSVPRALYDPEPLTIQQIRKG